jgi:hypothetical protein
MTETVGMVHAGSIGDVWASLPAVKEYHKQTGHKINFYLVKDLPAFYYEGATHPTKSDSGAEVMLNRKMIEMMIPLLEAQPFISECKVWEEEPYLVDLNQIRETYVGMPAMSINRWYFYVYPDLSCDLSGIWLTVPDGEKDLANGKILINRSERYRNDRLNYSFLKPYEDECVFLGTMREYNNFCMMFDLNIRKLHVDNFLEYAQSIKQSKFYMSNQSQGFQLAEGLKHPRILELSSIAPNVIPIGKDAYDFFAQDALEYYFHKLNGTYTQEVIEGFKENIKKSAEADLEKAKLTV